MFKDIIKYREYITSNATGELKYRYAGSSLGFFWNILNPVLQILVYTFVFSNIMRAKLPTLNNMGSFSLYLCSGMFGWLAFQEAVNRGTNTFVECSTFLKKLAIPEVVFIAQKTFSTFLNCVLNYSLIFVYGIIILKRVNIYWLFVPVILALLMLFAFGLATLLATVNAFLKDTVQVVNIVLMIWMWITPIVYVKEILPEAFMNFVRWNPIYPFVNSLQQIIVFCNPPEITDVLEMIIYTVIAVLLGMLVLKKNVREIRDVI